MKITSYVVSVVCMPILIASSYAFAQGTDEVENQTVNAFSAVTQQRPPWEAYAKATWFSSSAIQSTERKLSMGEMKAGFSRRFGIFRSFELSTGLDYSLRKIEAPVEMRLPESLQTISLNIGGEIWTTDRLRLGLMISPGISSDFKSCAANDIRVPVALHAKYQLSDTLSILGGVAYTGKDNSLPVLPILGMMYVPSDQWAFALGFSRIGAVFKPNRFLGVFIAGEYTNEEYRLHDSSIVADAINYNDFRVLSGFSARFLPYVKLGLSGGYAFSRKFVFLDGNREDVNLNGAPFGSFEVKFIW